MAHSDSPQDLRLIEDYLPIEAISREASREKSVRKGHISTLHLWWARRPLVACRAAVYGALVPADRFQPENGPEEKRRSLGRANAAKFLERLCKYPGDPKVIQEAQRHILQAHAERLTEELAEALKLPLPPGEGRGEGVPPLGEGRREAPKLPLPPAGEGWGEGAPGWLNEFKWPPTKARVTYEDIVEGRAPRPRVLDMFAGGGSIPLEALRLGCEAYALELNPVAHIIELCTLVYPQKYGKPDPTARGMTGPPINPHPDPLPEGEGVVRSWGGLAEEVRYWGNWVLERVRREIGDLYPPIPDPKAPKVRKTLKDPQLQFGGEGFQKKGQLELATETPTGYLTPVAYLWTRTVPCKNPSCGATVPLVKQTWLCKKKGRYVALRMIARKGAKQVRFEVVESTTEKGLGFDPAAFSKAGNATCPLCGSVADSGYVKGEGLAERLAHQPMALACIRKGRSGKVYLSRDAVPKAFPDAQSVRARIDRLCATSGLTVPTEPIINDAKGALFCVLYGIRRWQQVFSPRQILCLLTFADVARQAARDIKGFLKDEERARSLSTYLGAMVDKLADFNSAQCTWNYTGGRGVKNSFARQTLAMTWDYAETNPFNEAGASWPAIVEDIPAAIELLVSGGGQPTVQRGSATRLSWPNETFDAVITDPPYYDNVPYADISDFFYVWLKRTIGHLHPEHLCADGTPKKNEAVADAVRHGGDRKKATQAYEDMMAQAISEAHRTLKPGGSLALVYAHKTTLGWSTLVEALRQARFTVTQAWPLDTEMKGRVRAMDSAALAASIFLVGTKRDACARIGSYEDEVQLELEGIVRERVETLWDMGITGADLVIAAVGAGLRAFTKYERVEYANGEEVPAETFLTEVEAVVLDTLMAKISGAAGGRVSAVDPASRFYVLWRHVYKAADVPAGEAIVFQYGQDVELDGADGLSSGKDALLEKKKGKYRLRDYTERGGIDDLGLPDEAGGTPAPLIDVLHRALWLMDNRRPQAVREFLDEARPNREQLRALAATLAGPGLSGKSDEDRQRLLATTPNEQSALGKLLANWRSLVPESLFDSGRSR